MGRREDLASRERTGWAAFMDLVATMPPGTLDDRTVVPGWSAKDLVWHNAGWSVFAVDELVALGDAPFVDPFDAHDDAYWDALSEDMIKQGRTLGYGDLLTETERLREGMHAAWAAIHEPGDEAAAWFAAETFEHYEEHAGEIRAYLEAR
jgi:Mycothiol maleylpyruvate isomerase N-terminal domain